MRKLVWQTIGFRIQHLGWLRVRNVPVIFAVSVLVVAVFLAIATNYPGIVDLAANSQTTSGVVTSVEPSNHQRVLVSYSAAGRSHELVWDGIPSAAVGQPMVVYYLQSDPTEASLLWPRDLLLQATVQLATLSVLFGLVATYMVVVVRRRIANR